MKKYEISRRGFLGGAAALAGLPLLGLPRAYAQETGTLIYGLSGYPSTFMPWLNAGVTAGTYNSIVNRGLLSFAPDGSLQSELAESWENDGDRTWTFKLRDNARFHDGSPVTSADVKWSFEQIADPDRAAYMLAQFRSIETIETPDDQTVMLVMSQPTSTVPNWMANYWTPVVKAGSVDDEATGIGAGPFRMTSQERGVSMDFEAFPDYYKEGHPLLKAIKVISYSDENLRTEALLSGSVDLIDQVAWQTMASIEEHEGVTLDPQLGPFMYVMFNGSGDGPLSNPLVRKAIGYAIDRDAVVQAAFYGRGAALNGLPISQTSPFYNETYAAFWKRDLDLARSLLAEAGYADGFSTTLLATAAFHMYSSTAQIVQQNLAEIGIAVELSTPDWPTQASRCAAGQYDLAIMGSAMESDDPDGLTSFIDGSNPPALTRSYGINIPEISELLVQGRAELDPDKRKAIYDRLQQVTLDAGFFASICYRAQAYAYKNTLTGFTNLPGPLTFFSPMTLETASI